MTLRFAIFSILTATLGSLPLVVADYDFAQEFDCNNCHSKCGWWVFDIECHVNRAICISSVGLVDLYCQAAIDKCMLNHNPEADGNIQDANVILVEKNIFSQDFVDGIRVYSCDTLQQYGLAPTEDVVLVLDQFRKELPLLNLTKELAHEYYHNVQHARMGTEELYCKYIDEGIFKGKGYFNDNPIEKEAYDFEEVAGKCIFDNEGCPEIPIDQEKVDGQT